MSAPDLLAFPFDQFQRYTAAAQVADQIRGYLHQPRLRVLDVGGFFRTSTGSGVLPLAQFLPQDQVVVVDLAAEPLPGYALADGRALPFGSHTFDMVVSCDTLEHVPPEGRQAFVDELLRVADHALVLIAPFDQESSRLAEQMLDDYLTGQGMRNYQLREHLARGLPDADDLRAHLARLGMAYADWADGYLYNWLITMLIKHTPGLSVKAHQDFDRYYNRIISPTDRREPAYRRVFVVARPEDPIQPAEIADRIAGAAAPAPRSAILAGLVQALAQHQAPAAVAEMQARMVAVEAHNRELESTIAAYEKGRFMRFMRRVAKWRRKPDR